MRVRVRVRVVVSVRANPNLTLNSPGVAVGAMAVGVAVTPPRNSATGFELATGVELRPPPLPHVASAARVP